MYGNNTLFENNLIEISIFLNFEKFHLKFHQWLELEPSIYPLGKNNCLFRETKMKIPKLPFDPTDPKNFNRKTQPFVKTSHKLQFILLTGIFGYGAYIFWNEI
jgi:hypothetical protein